MLPQVKNRRGRLRGYMTDLTKKHSHELPSDQSLKKDEIRCRLSLYDNPEILSDDRNAVKQFLKTYGEERKALADEALTYGYHLTARKNRYLQIECRYLLMRLEYET